MKKAKQKQIKEAKKAIKDARKEIKEAEVAVKKAKKEILEAEQATGKAQDEVVEAAEVTRGNKRMNLTRAARDLEKAVYSAGESSEATEEAEFKVLSESRKNGKKKSAKKPAKKSVKKRRK